MIATIKGCQVMGTPEEIAEVINLVDTFSVYDLEEMINRDSEYDENWHN